VTDHALARVAWLLLAVALSAIATAAALVLPILDEPALEDVALASVVFPVIGVVTFAPVGALVASRRPRHPVGWLLLAIGLLVAMSLLTGALVDYESVHPGSVRAVEVWAWLSGNLWFVTLTLMPLLLLRFPSGTPVSQRWRLVEWLVLGLLLNMLLMSFKPGKLVDYPELENPFGLGILEPVAAIAEPVGLVLFLSSFVLAAASVVVRYRRSRGVERLQLKWVAFVVAFTALVWAGSSLLPSGWPEDVASGLGILLFCMIPISIGLAVLRYRLFEIDRLISKTVVYASVTVILGAAYVDLVLVAQRLFSSIAGGGDLAIAASTLVVAALFLPVRARVQRFVDRRFYRRRYDAQRTLEAFGARLRDEVELEVLAADLRCVVKETVTPAHAALWLRKAQP
jgi:hypothetical protein